MLTSSRRGSPSTARKSPSQVSYPKQPDVITLLRSYMRGGTAYLPYLFISNRGVFIDRRTLWCAMQTYGEKSVGGSIPSIGSKKIDSIQSSSIVVKEFM
jgi:hypothetical protein